MTSVDLPEPDTPVTAMNTPSGMSTVRFCRLLARAPTIRSRCLAGASRRPPGTGTRSSPRRYRPVSEVGCCADVLHRPLGDDLAAEASRPRPQVDHVVGGLDGVGVVLDHDDGVAQVAQAAQRAEQALVVPLVQPDARLVEDVEHADQAGADLGGQPDALGLAAGERGRAAAEREVVEPHVAEEAQPVGHFLEDGAGDVGVEAAAPSARCSRSGMLSKNSMARSTGRSTTSPMLAAVHQHRQALGLEPLAAAGLAGLLDHELLERRPHRVAGGLAVAPLDVPEHALPFALVLAPPAARRRSGT